MEAIYNSIIDILKSCEKEKDEICLQPTELFNEGWMLRLVLEWYSKNREKINKEDPLYFEPTSRWFSEALLKPPFIARRKKDPLAEKYTHADGVIGNFIIGKNGKGDLGLTDNAKQYIVLEAKIYSDLSPGISNDKEYDQVARSMACIAQAICDAELDIEKVNNLGFYVIAPEEQILKEKSFKSYIDKASIRMKVEKRVRNYDGGERINNWHEKWFGPVLDKAFVKCIGWKEILDYINKVDEPHGGQLLGFYYNCLKYNKNKVGVIDE